MSCWDKEIGTWEKSSVSSCYTVGGWRAVTLQNTIALRGMQAVATLEAICKPEARGRRGVQMIIHWTDNRLEKFQARGA